MIPPRFKVMISCGPGVSPTYSEVSFLLQDAATERELQLANGYADEWRFYTALRHVNNLPFTPSPMLRVIADAIRDDRDGDFVGIIIGKGGTLRLQFSDARCRMYISDVIIDALTAAGYAFDVTYDASVSWVIRG